MLLLKNAMINDAVHPTPYPGDLLIRNGIIERIEEDIPSSEGERILDLRGRPVFPGFVEAHCHLGLHGYGIGFEGQDFNEKNDIVTPHLRAIDGIHPGDEAFASAVRGGVTCVCTGPGSTNVLGGSFSVIKTEGICVDRMVLRREAAMKCALGENPKQQYGQSCNHTRMSTAAKLRESLFKAVEYKEHWDLYRSAAGPKPAFDMKLHALLPLVEKRIPLKVHAHRADDICTAIRIAKEFDLLMTLEHCTEGHRIVDLLSREPYPLAVGPTLTHASKPEMKHMSWQTPGILARAGCQVSIITDAPVVPQEYLPLCAGLAVKAGMDWFQALQAITIHAAKHVGVEDRVGSLEVGKDADLIVTDGDPLNSATSVLMTLINGRVVHSLL